LFNMTHTVKGLEYASKNPRNLNYQLNYVSPSGHPIVLANKASRLIQQTKKEVQNILDEYDFIGLTGTKARNLFPFELVQIYFPQ